MRLRRCVGVRGQVQRRLAVGREVERAGEVVRRAGRDDGERDAGARGRPRGEADRPVAAGDDEAVRRAHGAGRVADLVDVERLDVGAALAQGSGERGEVRVPAGPRVRHERETHHPKLPA